MKPLRLLTLLLASLMLVTLFASCDQLDLPEINLGEIFQDNANDNSTPNDKDVSSNNTVDNQTAINGTVIGNGGIKYETDENGNIVIGGNVIQGGIVNGGSVIVGGNNNTFNDAYTVIQGTNGNIVIGGSGNMFVSGVQTQRPTDVENFESYSNGIFTKGILNEKPVTWNGGEFWRTFELSEALINEIKADPEKTFNVSVSISVTHSNGANLDSVILSTSQNANEKLESVKYEMSLKSDSYSEIATLSKVKGSDLLGGVLYLCVVGETDHQIGEYSIKNVTLTVSPEKNLQ